MVVAVAEWKRATMLFRLNTSRTLGKSMGLQEHVGLSISGCLGPCSLNNVTLMMNGNERIWLGELGTTEHYEALIEWAKSISNNQEVSELPDLLVSHQFKPK